MRCLLTIPLALALLCLPAPAQAGKRDARYLWATVNVCDTEAAPNTIGVRASMPGNGTRQRLYMRFEAQYFDSGRGRWLATGSSSRWLRVGSARFRSARKGFSFQFGQLPPGTEFKLRGRVDYQWRGRRNGRPAVVRRRARITRARARGVEGSDPPSTAAATCVIR